MVDWWQVPEYAHLESGINLEPEEEGEDTGSRADSLCGGLYRTEAEAALIILPRKK